MNLKNLVFVLVAFSALQSLASSESLGEALRQCTSGDMTNPALIACNSDIQNQADAEIALRVSDLKASLTGVDAHNVDRSTYRHFIDEEVVAFQEYRDRSASASAAIEGGTGSDQQVAATSVSVAQTLEELAHLEQRCPSRPAP